MRFGIMCDGPKIARWQRAVLDALAEDNIAQPALLIENAGDADPPAITAKQQSKFHNLRSGNTSLWSIYNRYRAKKRTSALQPVDLPGNCAKLPTIRCHYHRKGKFSQYFAADDIAAIREHNLDFILRFGFNIIRGEVLDAARFGVWSFHHDDLDHYRGGPPCFWELYHDDPITGVTLQRLTDRLDGGVVLQKAFFSTQHGSLSRNRDVAMYGSADLPAKVCRDIAAGQAEYVNAAPSSSTAPILYAPTTIQFLQFALRSIRHKIRAKLSWFFQVEQWGVGIVDQPIHKFLQQRICPQARWLPNPQRHRFIADPSGKYIDDKLAILVEDFDYHERKGVMSVSIAKPDDEFPDAHCVMPLAVHLSYPYLFDFEGETYCIPETGDANEIALYRAVDFPEQWERVGPLVADFPGLDATVFEYDGRCWLFANTRPNPGCYKLYAWHADSPLGPYTPHALNPLKNDIRSTRPAGTPFWHDGKFYRPSQDCGATYGGAVTINEVTELSPTSFAESRVQRIAPHPRCPYPRGFHTIFSVGDRTLIDGKRYRFVPYTFSQNVLKTLRLK